MTRRAELSAEIQVLRESQRTPVLGRAGDSVCAWQAANDRLKEYPNNVDEYVESGTRESERKVGAGFSSLHPSLLVCKGSTYIWPRSMHRCHPWRSDSSRPGSSSERTSRNLRLRKVQEMAEIIRELRSQANKGD